MRTFALSGLILALSILSGAEAGAAEFVIRDGIEIHHNALRADFIPASVAKTHGITRSGSRGLINIALLRREVDGTTTPLEADITVRVQNLAGQSQKVQLRAVVEPAALYYIGQFRISGVDTYRFEAQVKVADNGQSHVVRWTQQLFAD